MCSDTTQQDRVRLVPRVLHYQKLREGDLVTRAGEAGLVEGVHVDFQHDGLPSGEWEARPWWVVWGAPPDSAGLIFPYEAKFDLDQYRRWVPAVADSPALYVRPGDRILIESVEDGKLGGPYDHPHDLTCKMVRLLLVREDGEEVRPPSPLAFYGTTQLRDAPPVEAYDRLAERVLAANNYPCRIEKLPGSRFAIKTNPQSIPDLGERALLCVGDVEEALAELVPTLDPRQLELVRRAVSGASLAGFSQGKFELRKAEEQAAGSARGREHGPKALRNDVWWDFASSAWGAEPQRSTYSIKEELITTGLAEPSQESAIYRQLKKHPLNPKRKD